MQKWPKISDSTSMIICVCIRSLQDGFLDNFWNLELTQTLSWKSLSSSMKLWARNGDPPPLLKFRVCHATKKVMAFGIVKESFWLISKRNYEPWWHILCSINLGKIFGKNFLECDCCTIPLALHKQLPWIANSNPSYSSDVAPGHIWLFGKGLL